MSDLNSVAAAIKFYGAKGDHAAILKLEPEYRRLQAEAAKPPQDDGQYTPEWDDVGRTMNEAGGQEISSTVEGAKNLAGSLISGPSSEQTKQDAQAGKFAPWEMVKAIAAPGVKLISGPNPEQTKADVKAGNFSPAGGKYTPITEALRGNDAPLRQNLGNRPIGFAGDILGPLSLTAPGRTVLGAITPSRETLANALRTSDRIAKPIVENVQNTITAPAVEASISAGQDARNVALIQQRAEREAARREALAGQLRRRSEGSAPNVETIGDVRNPSEIGRPLQEEAVRRQEKLRADRGALDEQLREARDAAVAEREGKGETIRSTSAYQRLMDRLKTVTKKSKVGGPETVDVNPDRERLYNEVQARVGSQKTKLTLEEYREAEARGSRVGKGFGDNGEEVYYRLRTPSFKSIDETRRWLGEAFNDPMKGYKAISDIEKKNLYKMLDDVEEEFAGGTAHPDLQRNWRSASARLKDFDTKAGQTLTKEMGDTGELRLTPAEIPGQVFGKGPEGIDRLTRVTGNPALVQRGVQDYVASQLAGRTGAQVQSALGPTGKLADLLGHEGAAGTATNVRTYMRDLLRSERDVGRAARETALAENARTGATRVGEEATRAAQAHREAANAAHARLSAYDNMDPREVVKQARKDIQADLANERITPAQHDDLERQINEAVRLHGKTDRARRMIKHAFYASAAASGTGMVTRQVGQMFGH